MISVTKIDKAGLAGVYLCMLMGTGWGQASPNAASLETDVSAAQGEVLLCTRML